MRHQRDGGNEQIPTPARCFRIQNFVRFRCIIVTIYDVLINVFYLKRRLIRVVKIKKDVDPLFSAARLYRLAQENGAEGGKALLSIE